MSPFPWSTAFRSCCSAPFLRSESAVHVSSSSGSPLTPPLARFVTEPNKHVTVRELPERKRRAQRIRRAVQRIGFPGGDPHPTDSRPAARDEVPIDAGRVPRAAVAARAPRIARAARAQTAVVRGANAPSLPTTARPLIHMALILHMALIRTAPNLPTWSGRRSRRGGKHRDPRSHEPRARPIRIRRHVRHRPAHMSRRTRSPRFATGTAPNPDSARPKAVCRSGPISRSGPVSRSGLGRPKLARQ